MDTDERAAVLAWIESLNDGELIEVLAGLLVGYD